MSRINTHKIESQGLDNFRKIVNKNNGLFRELSGRDYGIDGMIEIFSEQGSITGRILLVQVKTTSENIEKNKRSNDISISLSVSSLEYSKQKNIPFVLIHNSLKKEDEYYYCLLNGVDYFDNQKSSTIRIPLENKSINSISGIKDLCDAFDKK
jgi:hypothetical protein